MKCDKVRDADWPNYVISRHAPTDFYIRVYLLTYYCHVKWDVNKRFSFFGADNQRKAKKLSEENQKNQKRVDATVTLDA